jgi:hypothetical protein
MKQAAAMLFVPLVVAAPCVAAADATPTPSFKLGKKSSDGVTRATLPLPSAPQSLATMKRLQAQWRMVGKEDTLLFKAEQRLTITSPEVSLEALYTVNDAGALGIQIGLPNAPMIVRSVEFPDEDTLSLTDVANKQTFQYKRVK